MTGAGAAVHPAPMSVPTDLSVTPADLPVPRDDGACDHLPGRRLPSVALPATSGGTVDPSSVSGRLVVYVYPMTGRPGHDLPTGWDAIPGARGCTPQSCAFRDHAAEIGALGAALYGLSTQRSAYQREAAERLRLPFDLLSDATLGFSGALGLPTFEVDGMTLIRRLTLIASGGTIEKVFYPVFPPERNAGDVVAWLGANG